MRVGETRSTIFLNHWVQLPGIKNSKAIPIMENKRSYFLVSTVHRSQNSSDVFSQINTFIAVFPNRHAAKSNNNLVLTS